MSIYVNAGNMDKAIQILKRKMTADNIFKELEWRSRYVKKSERIKAKQRRSIARRKRGIIKAQKKYERFHLTQRGKAELYQLNQDRTCPNE